MLRTSSITEAGRGPKQWEGRSEKKRRAGGGALWGQWEGIRVKEDQEHQEWGGEEFRE